MTPQRVKDRVMGNWWLDDNGCWISRYSTASHGYAQIGWAENGKRCADLCHRVAWEVAYGPIPDDMTIDHICRKRPCIRPDHLRLLTNLENATDNGQGSKTHCPKGHEYTPENTRTNAKGHRWCRACQTESNARRYV